MKKDWIGNYTSVFSTLGASNHSDKEREQNDYYATDPIAIDPLMSVIDMPQKYGSALVVKVICQEE